MHVHVHHIRSHPRPLFFMHRFDMKITTVDGDRYGRWTHSEIHDALIVLHCMHAIDRAASSTYVYMLRRIRSRTSRQRQRGSELGWRSIDRLIRCREHHVCMHFEACSRSWILPVRTPTEIPMHKHKQSLGKEGKGHTQTR